MKCTTNYSIGFALLLSSAQIQLGQPIPAQVGVAAEESPAGSAAYQIVSRGPNERVWSRVTWGTNAFGKAVARTNCFTELETSMHHWRNGQWLESEAKIELLADGAAATNGPCQVYFAANLNSPSALIVTAPDGRIFRSRVYGIAFYDSSSGKAVLIGETKDSIGLLVGDNEVLYTNAFEGNGIEGEVQYFYNKAGIEQNIVIRSQIPAPSEFGMAPASTLLQVISEFYDPPLPSKTTRMLDGNLADETLDFGAMKMGSGRAFSIGAAGETGASVPVTKEWGVVERGVAAGRAFLVEQVPFTRVEKQIQALERKKQGASLIPIRESRGATMMAALRNLPPKPTARQSGGKLQMAKLAVSPLPPQRAFSAINHQPSTISPQRAFILDYTLLTSQSNLVLKGGTTWYVSGTVNLAGTTTVEGTAVLKFTNHPSAKLVLSGPLVCKNDAWRPAIFTSKDDRTVGDDIPGSTGNPTNYNGGTYLQGPDATTAYQYLRMSYAGTGIYGYPSDVWHCQFVRCGTAIKADDDADIRLRNVLFSQCGTAVYIGGGNTLAGEHVTADQLNKFFDAPYCTGTLTNCILTAVTNIGTNVTLYYCTTNASGNGIYQTVGAASYYLTDGSTNRNAGTTNINSDLAKDLKKKTTYPPIELTSNFTVDTTLSPQAQRDTDTPDLGYLYDPLDYVVSGRTLTNATLTLTNGVALGTYGASTSQGISIVKDGKLISGGSPAMLNHIVRYNTVQEQANTNWSAATVAHSIKIGTGTGQKAQFRFTDWSLLGKNGYHFYVPSASSSTCGFQDCQFRGGGVYIYDTTYGLTNCLWERVAGQAYGQSSGTQLWMYNNLVKGGSWYWEIYSSSPWIARDNTFDSCTLNSVEIDLTSDHNAYVNVSVLSGSGGSDKTLTNADYQIGALGRYYYPTNGGQLSTLIDAGSRWATNATLYHFTTTTNQVKEASSKVDIGFHYVAVDPGTGLPVDTDGDGWPDYLEDRDGNGTVESGETDWNNPNDLGLRVIITRPSGGGPLP